MLNSATLPPWTNALDAPRACQRLRQTAFTQEIAGSNPVWSTPPPGPPPPSSDPPLWRVVPPDRLGEYEPAGRVVRPRGAEVSPVARDAPTSVRLDPAGVGGNDAPLRRAPRLCRRRSSSGGQARVTTRPEGRWSSRGTQGANPAPSEASSAATCSAPNAGERRRATQRSSGPRSEQSASS
jgi:hypothetical protein